MSKEKKSFIAYYDWKETFDELPDAEAGALIKHIFAYVNNENPQTENIIIKAVFASIKNTINRDLEKWQNQLKQRSDAGKKSSKSRQRNSTSVKNRGTKNNETERNPTDNVSVSVSVSDTSLEKNQTIDWDGLISFFNLTFGKSSRIISKEVKSKYNARLKEGYLKKDILNAMTNASNDSYHKENNYKHCTIEFFSRPEKLEKFSSISNNSLLQKGIESPKISRRVARDAMNVPALMEDLIKRGATRKQIEGIDNGTIAPTGSDY
jgi:hypothetical protein